MVDEDTGWNWHDQRGVTWAAGLAAFALIVLLVWAVMRTATESTSFPGLAPPARSSATSLLTSATRKTPSTTTSYTLPSVLTSEGTATPAPPTVEAPTFDEPTPTTPTSTTIFNPYVTTTQPNGDAV